LVSASYDDINRQAEDFLREHKRNEILPVDIEAIAAKLIGIYDVSADVLNKRISKELEKGYLSLE